MTGWTKNEKYLPNTMGSDDLTSEKYLRKIYDHYSVITVSTVQSHQFWDCSLWHIPAGHPYNQQQGYSDDNASMRALMSILPFLWL